jgi:hypothetical protein
MNCGAARSQIANSTAAPGPIALGLSLGAGVWSESVVALLPDEKVLFVHTRGHRHVEKPHHHFVVGLLAPAHFCLRVWIVRIRFRVVVPRDGLKFRSRS